MSAFFSVQDAVWNVHFYKMSMAEEKWYEEILLETWG